MLRITVNKSLPSQNPMPGVAASQALGDSFLFLCLLEKVKNTEKIENRQHEIDSRLQSSLQPCVELLQRFCLCMTTEVWLYCDANIPDFVSVRLQINELEVETYQSKPPLQAKCVSG